jgi:hypothetical protein
VCQPCARRGMRFCKGRLISGSQAGHICGKLASRHIRGDFKNG